MEGGVFFCGDAMSNTGVETHPGMEQYGVHESHEEGLFWWYKETCHSKRLYDCAAHASSMMRLTCKTSL